MTMTRADTDPLTALRAALSDWATRTEPWTGPASMTAEDGYNAAIEEVVAMLNDRSLAATPEHPPYPLPEDFRAMTDAEFNAYIERTGFAERIDRAMAAPKETP